MSPLPRQGWLFLIEFLKWYFSKYWQVRTRPVFAQTVTNNQYTIQVLTITTAYKNVFIESLPMQYIYNFLKLNGLSFRPSLGLLASVVHIVMAQCYIQRLHKY